MKAPCNAHCLGQRVENCCEQRKPTSNTNPSQLPILTQACAPGHTSDRKLMMPSRASVILVLLGSEWKPAQQQHCCIATAADSAPRCTRIHYNPMSFTYQWPLPPDVVFTWSASCRSVTLGIVLLRSQGRMCAPLQGAGHPAAAARPDHEVPALASVRLCSCCCRTGGCSDASGRLMRQQLPDVSLMARPMILQLTPCAAVNCAPPRLACCTSLHVLVGFGPPASEELQINNMY
jgi:hypothetical protein